MVRNVLKSNVALMVQWLVSPLHPRFPRSDLNIDNDVEDNIKEWTGLEWNILLRKAENREEWRKLVVKCTVVPQRSARLRDG